MIKGVIVDVDGTLVDNSWFHTIAWLRAARECGIAVHAAQLSRLIGMGDDQLPPALTGEERPDLVEAHERHMATFQKETRALPGAARFLTTMHGLGVQLCVATSSGADTARTSLSLVIDDLSLIDTLVTRDDVAATKPRPDLVAVALERSGLPVGETVMVGDTSWDAVAAARCGVTSIGLLTGGFAEAELREAGAAAVYPTLEDLLDGLEASPLAVI